MINVKILRLMCKVAHYTYIWEASYRGKGYLIDIGISSNIPPYIHTYGSMLLLYYYRMAEVCYRMEVFFFYSYNKIKFYEGKTAKIPLFLKIEKNAKNTITVWQIRNQKGGEEYE